MSNLIGSVWVMFFGFCLVHCFRNFYDFACSSTFLTYPGLNGDLFVFFWIVML